MARGARRRRRLWASTAICASVAHGDARPAHHKGGAASPLTRCCPMRPCFRGRARPPLRLSCWKPNTCPDSLATFERLRSRSCEEIHQKQFGLLLQLLALLVRSPASCSLKKFLQILAKGLFRNNHRPSGYQPGAAAAAGVPLCGGLGSASCVAMAGSTSSTASAEPSGGGSSQLGQSAPADGLRGGGDGDDGSPPGRPMPTSGLGKLQRKVWVLFDDPGSSTAVPLRAIY